MQTDKMINCSNEYVHCKCVYSNSYIVLQNLFFKSSFIEMFIESSASNTKGKKY